MTTTAARPISILLQTTIPFAEDDWYIGRFRLLRDHLAATEHPFKIAVAFASHDGAGRGWAESTFHHFCDDNWDVSAGSPSFVGEKPSDAIARNPALLDDTKQYVENLVRWLGRRPR